MLLADIFDVLAMINSNLVAIGSHKKTEAPERYPRPWKTDDGKKHIGSGALPPDELRKWFDERRKQHGIGTGGR